MGPYSLRIPVVIALVAAAARMLLDAPPIVPYVVGAVAVAYLSAFQIRSWLSLRAYRRAHPIVPPAEGIDDDWKQCDATIPIAPGGAAVLRCTLTLGHDDPHEGSTRDNVTWPQ